jgi:PIN domain nuclease of toxin-antitoxin system
LILLDTHVLIWADFGLPSLGECALAAIAEASTTGTVAVSAISFWEAAMLAAKGRIALPVAPQQWRRALLETGLIELPVSGDVGIQATELAGLHPDPADRLICAAALHAGATLVTADTALLDWDSPVQKMDARV